MSRFMFLGDEIPLKTPREKAVLRHTYGEAYKLCTKRVMGMGIGKRDGCLLKRGDVGPYIG